MSDGKTKIAIRCNYLANVFADCERHEKNCSLKISFTRKIITVQEYTRYGKIENEIILLDECAHVYKGISYFSYSMYVRIILEKEQFFNNAFFSSCIKLLNSIV